MASIIVETWAWYGLSVTVVGARFLSRRLLFDSFKSFQADDWLMIFSLLVYTALLIIIHIQSYTPTNLIDPAQPLELSPEEIQLREYGSKLVLVTEHLQMIVIWSVKGCLLILYGRLTMSLRHNRTVKFVTYYVIASYIIMVSLWFVWCRPFNAYWAVPAPHLNCSAETNHMITNAVFNISSDIMIIALPMPVLMSAKLPLKRKIILMCVFALGIFNILAAILSKYYSLATPYGTLWIYWYIRETSTAIIVANLPLTWTLMQRIFGVRGFYSRNKSTNPQSGYGNGPNKVRSAYGNLSSHTNTKDTKPLPKPPHPLDISPSESQEKIYGMNNVPLRIWQHQEVRVTSEEAGSLERSSSDKTDELVYKGGRSANTSGRPSQDHSAQNGEMGMFTHVSRSL